MNTIAFINFYKDTLNLKKIIEINKNVLNSQDNHSLIVSACSQLSNINIDNYEVVNSSISTDSYSSYFFAALNHILKNTCSLTTDEALNHIVAFIPDTLVFSDKTINYAFSSFIKSNLNLCFLGLNENKLVSITDTESDKYNLYSLYSKKPDSKDYETAIFIRLSVLRDLFSDSNTPINQELKELKNHFLGIYLYLNAIKNEGVVSSIVNERMSVFNEYSDNCIPLSSYKHDDKIAKQLNLIPTQKLSFKQKLFSITNFNRHIYVTIAGLSISFKIKHEPKFPKEAIEFSNASAFEHKIIEHKRACLFASFTAQGLVGENTIKYLKALRKFNDYIIYVADSKALPSTIEQLSKLVDVVVIQRHHEYDFGSYKIGFEILNNHKILDSIDSLLICNDSVDFVGNSDDLADIFNKAKSTDAYAMCKATYGFGNRIKRHKYEWVKNPHLQSYFLILNKTVFTQNYFKDFIQSVKQLKNKRQIIKEYEMGLSELLKENHVNLDSYYPYDETNIVNPYAIYLDSNVEKPIFVKHMLSK